MTDSAQVSAAAEAAASSRPGRQSRHSRGAKQAGPRASIRELLPYLFEQKKLVVLAFALGIGSAALSLLQPVLLGQIIQRVQAQGPLGVLLVALCAVLFVGALLSGFQHYVLQRMGEGVVLSSRRRLIAKVLNLPISQFDMRRTGDIVSRIGSDTTLLRAVLTQGLVEALSGSLVFIGALIGMLVIDPVLFGATALVLALSLAVIVGVSARIRPAMTKAQERVGDLAAQVERAVSNIRTIRAAGATERETAETTSHAEAAYAQGLKVARISAAIVPASFIAMQLCFLVVIGFGGFRVATGSITIASLVTFIVFLFMLLMPLGQAVGAVLAVNQALGALGRIKELVRQPSEDAADAALSPTGSVAPLAAVAVQDAPALELRDVHFTYRSLMPDVAAAGANGAGVAAGAVRETPVLHGVSFAVPRGARVAIVGPSGAGKSTILGLLERFYDPDSGSIHIYGADLRSVSRADLRSQLGYVEQDSPILAGTLGDNLRLAKPAATDAECLRVLQAVGLAGLLVREQERGHAEAAAVVSAAELPAGADLTRALAQPVGEKGIMLSGGERQRLAIARALLTAPPILLLDESTANLDAINEKLMREALDTVATGRSLVVIAHRLATVVDSDLIVVLQDGRVIGQGTHEELLESTPLYRELAKNQLLVAE